MNSLKVGTVLHGKSREYKIEKVLGQGSFGITYLATTKVQVQESLGSLQAEMKVAVKEFFMKDLNGREGTRVTSISSGGKEGLCEKYKAKFIKESQNLSKLQHPGIVKVLESFEANGTAYYVMEYCEGGSLEERIKSHGGLGEGEAKSLACKIGDALIYMHSRGMLHLDLKPGNIMLRADGSPVVIDFGLSKQYTSDGKAESSTTVGLGTPGYAPIEQGDYQESKGKFPVTMDVYAFGATVFKMLTGNTPPEASDILNDGFPAYELQDKNVSITTIRAIKKAMANRVVDRCQTVKEFVTLLGEEGTMLDYESEKQHREYEERRSREQEVQRRQAEEERKKRDEAREKDPPPPAPKPNYLKYILGVLGVVLGVVIGVVLINNDSAPEPVVEEVVAEEEVVDRGTIRGHEWVDLGLSVKWATCNVGASQPYDYGDYYAWGETTTKSEYTPYNSCTYGANMSDISGNSNYDAARANWGGSWRMPTEAEMEELKRKCTWTWTSQSGVKGYKVTGHNGNSIFLPAAGRCGGSSRYYVGEYVGEYGFYWSSTPDESATDFACSLGFLSGGLDVDWNLRYYGRTVRPVSE